MFEIDIKPAESEKTQLILKEFLLNLQKLIKVLKTSPNLGDTNEFNIGYNCGKYDAGFLLECLLKRYGQQIKTEEDF